MDSRFHHQLTGLDSSVHRLDPRTKILLVLAYAVIVVSTPPSHLLAFVAYAGLLSWAIAWARVPLTFILLRAAAVLPFSALAALWLPFLKEGPTVGLLGGSLQLSIAGLWLLAGVAMKSFLGAAAAVFLTVTTPFHALLGGLRKMGLPLILIDTLTLTYRYLFVLVDEAMRLRRAAAARGYRPRWLGQALLVGRLIGQLFMRSYERAERVYGAMVQRGYRGQMPTAHHFRFRGSDAATLVVLSGTLVAVRAFLR